MRAGSSPAVRTIALGAAAALGGCDRDDDRPVIASVIAAPAPTDVARDGGDAPARTRDGAVMQGLLRFDAAGQVEPGIAERWIVIDDGMSYIFRLRDATWADGRRVTAPEVAAALRKRLANRSRNPLLPFLSAIDEIVAMTPEVLEVRLSRPRPDLLKLFAQPEMAVMRAEPPSGAGPFRLASRDRTGVLLRPVVDPDRDPDDPAPGPGSDVRLIRERAALAIARFVAGSADMVTGGSFADWPLAAEADVGRTERRLDPAAGLLGLAFASREGFLADPANRYAIAGAFDRAAIAAQFPGAWTAAEQIVPETLDSAAPPVSPAWSQLSTEQRRASAAERVRAWRATHAGALTLRVALPSGPGANLLWGQIGAALIAIGVTPERVAMGAPAELALVDAVAPYDSARWYLVTACRPCGPEASAALEAARLAPTLAARAQAIAAADLAVTTDVSFVMLGRPLRWSLVSRRLREWQPNPRAWHPLNHLRADTR